jgi:hypothetical protein
MGRWLPLVMLVLGIVACVAAFWGESSAAYLPDIDGAVIDAGMAPR